MAIRSAPRVPCPGRDRTGGAVYEARLALQTRAADAWSRAQALDAAASARDPGLLTDKAAWLRSSNQSAAARQLLASRPRFDRPPANPARYLDLALTLARGAANDRNWQTAYGIASRVDDLYAPGVDVSDRPYGERDDYTSLTWLGGQAAYYRLNRPGDAARLFQLYGQAARSPQTRAKGFFWAARAAQQAGRGAEAQQWLARAADSPDQFYGQLALERLGRSPPPPPVPQPVTAAERAAFAQRPMAEAIRYLGMVGRRGDQTLFIRALAGTLDNDRERGHRRRVRPARSAGSTWASGQRARRAPRATASTPARLSPNCPCRRLMRTSGPSRMRSSARKARSSGPRSHRSAPAG